MGNVGERWANLEGIGAVDGPGDRPNERGAPADLVAFKGREEGEAHGLGAEEKSPPSRTSGY